MKYILIQHNLAVLLFSAQINSSSAKASVSNGKAAVGRSLGPAVCGALGWNSGEVLGGAITTKGKGQMGAVIGGAGGAYAGRAVSGSGTGGVLMLV